MTYPIPILMYHQIDIPRREAKMRGLYVHPRSFARQMWLLKRLGYRAMSISRLAPYLRDAGRGRVIGLTFDDGYLDNLQNALPVLMQQGFSATCYIISDNIGKHNRWNADRVGVRRPLLDRRHIREWLSAGMDIGSHTLDHPHLTHCDRPEAWRQISDSKRVLEDLFGRSIEHFCYPFGDYTPEIRDMVGEAGYRTATTTRRGRVRRDDDPLALPRVAVYYSTWLHLFWVKITTAYEDRRRQR
jgi:peptidoglycan/xylan/chitin deacetylase (PgdA/CDA1 family)